jgi:hypothetical protein
MIVFVALWLASTVFLVILYTGHQGLASDNARLTEDNARLISASERNSVALFKNAKQEGPTVVGLLEGQRAESVRLATGDPADDAAAVQYKLDQHLQKIRSEGLVPQARQFEDVSFDEALSMLYDAFDAEHAQLRAATDRVAELEAEVDRLVKANSEVQDDFDARARELQDRLAQAENERAEKLRERDESLAALSRDFEETRRQSDADLTQERQRVSALREQVAQLQERYATYRAKFGELLMGPEELSTAREPDGQVLTAIPGDDVVYIDLGRKDSLTLGLQFAVYAAETGIPPDGKGKGQIEVVSIAEESAECKIVHLTGYEVILEGDLIANPIYDRDRPVSFMVAGLFDLDYDGLSDGDGTATIESIITGWGGIVSSELTALTDFVVLGKAPRRPRTTRETPGGRPESEALREAYDRYMETVESAKSLSVPIMTQEVFLNFLGYRRR